MSWSQNDAIEAERRYAAGLPLSLRQVAHVLNLTHQRGSKKGQPDRRLVLDRIADGRLRVVDQSAPSAYLTVAVAEIGRYLSGKAA